MCVCVCARVLCVLLHNERNDDDDYTGAVIEVHVTRQKRHCHRICNNN